MSRIFNTPLISIKEILSFKEAIAYMDVSSSYLYKLTASKQISHFKPSGKRIYFRRACLDQWMTSNKCESIADGITEAERFISKADLI